MINEKKNLRHGTTSTVREKFGINLSNQYSPQSSTTSQVAEKIRYFMRTDDIRWKAKVGISVSFITAISYDILKSQTSHWIARRILYRTVYFGFT